MKKINFMKHQNGAIVVEAAFVFPIVIIVVFILVYMALIQIQQITMYMQAQYMAQKVCSILTFPGYDDLYEEAYGNKYTEYTRLPNTYMPSPNMLSAIYMKHNPYRYLGGIYLNSSKNSSDRYYNYEKDIAEIIRKSVYFKGKDIKSDINVSLDGLSTAVTVKIDYKLSLPKFMSILGVKSNTKITAKAVSYANDTVDFIRNTDLAFDLFDYFLKKYNLEGKFNTFYKKIKQISEKIL